MGIEQRYISFRGESTSRCSITPQEYQLMKIDFRQFLQLANRVVHKKNYSYNFFYKYFQFKIFIAAITFVLGIIFHYLHLPFLANSFILLAILAVFFTVLQPFRYTYSGQTPLPSNQDDIKTYYQFHLDKIERTNSFEEYQYLLALETACLRE